VADLIVAAHTVFELPTSVSRVKVTGARSGYSSDFIVKIGGSLVVNELLGTGWSRTYVEGTYLTSGGVVQITSSTGVCWSFAQVRTGIVPLGFRPLIDR